MSDSESRSLTIQIPSDDELGPHMRRLNERQKKYVIAYLMNPSSTGHTQAAIDAGYGNGKYEHAKQQAWLLSHNPKVLAALKEEADRRMKFGIIIAASRLIEIVEDKSHKDNFKAVVETLNRGGLIVETQHRVITENDDSLLSVVERVKKQALALGLDPVQLLATIGMTLDDNGEVIQNQKADPREGAVDAEFEEVDDDEWTV